MQSAVATAIDVPQNKIVVETVRVGGAFGGKTSNNIPLCVAVAGGPCAHMDAQDDYVHPVHMLRAPGLRASGEY